MNKNRLLVPAVFVFCIIFFFKSFFLNGLLPIPSDLLMGLFHPFRDSVASEYPRGIPFKNFLLTDPITQQIPWRALSLKEISSNTLPLWNPYQMAGYPLLGNIQSAPFYPLNFLFLFLPFSYAWSLLIFSQPLLAMTFMYLYLRSLRLSRPAGILGSITFAFCGFMTSWLEWGTIGSTVLWLPLMLFALNEAIAKKNSARYSILLGLSIICSYLAGHTQTFFYAMVVLVTYAFFYLFLKKLKFRQILNTLWGPCIGVLALVPVILIQFQFLNLSARGVDLDWQKDGWFIPLQNVIQFLVPNFFGNPATGNYWGVWNYGEFLGYIGILPLLLAIYAVIISKRRIVYFFGGIVILSIFFAFETPLAVLPFKLQIPFLSSAQPTRLLFLIDFSLAVLAAFGMDKIFQKGKTLIIISTLILLSLVGIYLATDHLTGENVVSVSNWSIVQRNLVLPTLFVFISLVISCIVLFLPILKRFVPGIIIVITILDLFLIMQKFTPFTKEEYFYPRVEMLSFLKDESGINRVMSLDRRIMHPNIATKYEIQFIEGYDPLYLLRFGELLAASNRAKPDISTPFGFSRIVTTDRYQTPIINLLGVKYILSLDEINDPNLEKVFEQGQTKVYLNKKVLPRVFFVTRVSKSSTKQDSIDFIFKEKDLLTNAVVESDQDVSGIYSSGMVAIDSYLPNKIALHTSNKEKGFLILTDTYYPTWKAFIDGKQTSIYLTDFSFRGLVVPKGEHRVEFINTLFTNEN